MKRWILNSTVLTGQGTWTYWLIDRDMAAYWLSLHARDATSRIGHEAAAKHVAELASIPGWRPALSQKPFVIEMGDEALVVCLPSWVMDPSIKYAPQAWEYGILKRLTHV